MQMTEILKAIIFGIVEGITEWLPVSSTGHMILLNEFLPLNMSQEFYDMFLVVIQLGAIMAVVLTFWNSLWPFSFKKGESVLRKDVWQMWFKIVVSCIPAVIVEFTIGDYIEEMFYNYKTVAIMLILFGIFFIIAELRNENRKPKINSISEITYMTAFIIGCFQLIAAIFPGTSRSGATILGALLIGVSRTVAAEYTFFLAVPVMFGASLIKIIKYGFSFTSLEAAVLITGMVVAFIVSMIIIKFLMGYIKKHDFKVFGYYRIVLGAAVLFYFGLWV
ncbi:MAG: undecaprenyl-diphosphate phosphatase [Eubacterium sp.]|nr:undecaprenyl-diphosphate phosphatase [Eubacterium sp.]